MLPECFVKTGLVAATLFLMLSGCAAVGDSGKNLSRDEKATLNLQMGVRYLDMGMLEVAKEKLDTAYELDSDNPEILNAMAVLYERIGQADNARIYYQNSMRLNPNSATVKNNYGRFLCDGGLYSEGIELLKQASEMPLNSKKWLTYTILGMCYQKQQKIDEAELAFRRALSIQPAYVPALQEMQQISYQNRNYMSARAFLERYLAVANHTPQTLWIGIQTERALGNKKRVEKYQRDLLSLFPGSEQAHQIRTATNR
jgi:type IV pilus assembly protein PilF